MYLFFPALTFLLISALFSGIETAYAYSNKLRIEVDKNRDIYSARILSKFVNNETMFMSTIWFGRILTLITYAILSAELFWQLLINNLSNEILIAYPLAIVLQFFAIFIIYYLVAELLTKLIFRLWATSLLKILAIPAYLVYILFYPLIKSFVFIAGFIFRYILGDKTEINNYLVNSSDINSLLDTSTIESSGSQEEMQEIKMFRNARDLSNIKLREFMIPRNEIVSVDINESPEKLSNLITESGHSKILVYDETIDNIIGYAHAFDIFAKPTTIQEMVKPVIFVPGSMSADKLLNKFIVERKSVALVVDEFGGTDGILTIEDILEEVFGDIADEYDIEDFEDRQIADNQYIVSGRSEIDYLNEKYNLTLPESDDYQTIAGYIIFKHESIPMANEEILIENRSFRILKATESRIEQVLINTRPIPL